MPKTDQPIDPRDAEIASLRDSLAATEARQDKMLDLMVEMQEKLETGQTVTVAGPSTESEKLQGEMDAELAALREEFKDFEAIDVATRRATVGGDVNLDIRLKDEPDIKSDPDGDRRKWMLRWGNYGKEGRAQELASLSYVKVRIEEVQNVEALGIYSAQDQYVRKGERGLEVLHKIPLKLYLHLKHRERLARDGVLNSESRLLNHLANGTAKLAAKAGDNADQAGSTTQSRLRVSLTEGPKERVTL